MKKMITIWLAVLFLTQSGLAQTSTTNNSSIRRNVATVMFTGLAGAVLGLSTLSFYGEPQDHIGNIWTGLGIGVLAGSAYVFSRSTSSNSTADLNERPNNPHQTKLRKPNIISYSWDF